MKNQLTQDERQFLSQIGKLSELEKEIFKRMIPYLEAFSSEKDFCDGLFYYLSPENVDGFADFLKPYRERLNRDHKSE